MPASSRRGRRTTRRRPAAPGPAPQARDVPRPSASAADLAEAILDALVENSQHQLVYLDRNFNFLRVNRAYAETCRRRPEDFLGRNHFELYPHAENQAIFERVRDTGEPAAWREKPFVFPDQPERGTTWWDWTLTPVKDASGAVTGLVFSLRDVTEKVVARERLRDSEREASSRAAELDATFAALDFPVMVFGASGTVVRANPAARAVLGRDAAGLPAEAWAGLVIGERGMHHADDRPLRPEELPSSRALRGEAVQRQVVHLCDAAGHEHFFEATGMPLREGGRLAGAAVAWHDVTERQWAEEALRAANAQLLEADRHKNAFIATLSHELRNPLAPIRNCLYVLERAEPGGEQARRALEVVNRQVEQLARLVDDLLDLTRISSRKVQLHPASLDLGDLVRCAVEDHRSLFERSGVAVDLDLPPCPVPVRGDRNRLSQVVGNLLQNAVKFSRRGGRTRVSASADAEAGRATVRVADDGMGMSPELLLGLFQPFRQADATLNRPGGGLGLGLALVKGIVELHGGDVSARSAGPGLGSELAVSLPLDSTGAPAPTPGPAPPPPARRRVLVIEDNADAAQSLREALELGGHEVAVAADGPAGVARAQQLRPDVVLCDIGLPGMDGFEVARALRADPALARTVLVALSGYAQPSDRRRAAEAGFDRHLAKPSSLDQIEELFRGLGQERA